MKILYVTTISNTVNTFLIPHIKMLKDEGHQVDVAFKIEQEVKADLIKLGCKIHHVPFDRSPLRKDNIKAYKKIKDIIISNSYDLVHTHTPVASAIVRLACKKSNDVKVFYTAHGFHFYKGAPLINWLVYYPVEKWMAKYTEVLITINKEDYKRAKRKFKSEIIMYVPGVGINLGMYSNPKIDKFMKRNEMGIDKESFVILSIGELNKNKNHEVAMRAVAKLNNPKIHYVICGQGHLEGYLKKMSKILGLENQVHFLGFRQDIPEIFKISDIFVFPSSREGLSVALMEAMANALPIICTNIRGNSDLIEDGKGGYLVKPGNVDGFAKDINKLISDTRLRNKMGEFNLEKIEKYSIENILSDMKKIYFKLELVDEYESVTFNK